MEDFNSKYTGQQVEDLLDQIASGNAGGGGGGGITKETDPVFSNSPAATITEEKIAEWNAKSEQGEKGDKGDTGVGVQSVAQTTTSNADGGSNVVTVTLTNGTTSTFNVKNGSKGSSGSNGTNGKDGADGATFTPSVDSAGNLSWTNNKGLANPPTVNIKGPKGDTGEGGGDVVNTPKYIQWDDMWFSFGAADEMTPNVKYVCTQPIGTIMFEESLFPYDCWHGGVTDLYNEYSIIFEANETDIQAPDYFRWVNGTIPTMENGVRYELSIALMYINNDYIAHAVLTPFKPLE